MYARITLFKSGFDPGNCFVGENKQARESALANLPKLELPISAFNPRRPFRIAGNFLQYDRVYDYLKYELSTDSDLSNAQVRYYYLTSAEYVNDNETDLNIQEDYLGTFFHDLKFSRIAPERYTYQKNIFLDPKSGVSTNLTNLFASDFQNDTFLYERYGDSRCQVTRSGIFYAYLGFIVNVSTSNLDTYSEFGIEYPLGVTLIPFLHDGSNIISGWEDKFYLQYKGQDGSTPTNNRLKLAGINYFKQYFEQSTDGFKFIDNFIWTSCHFFTANIVTQNNTEIVVLTQNFGYTEDTIDTRVIGSGPLNDLHWLLVKQLPLKDKLTNLSPKSIVYEISFSRDDFLFRKPFQTVVIQQNNEIFEFDPMQIGSYKSATGEKTITLSFFQSLVPPFNIEISTENSISNGIPYPNYLIFNTELTFEFAPHKSFFSYTDTYTEYLRSNYNSMITGLKVKQDAQTAQFALKAGAQGINNALSLATSPIGSKNPVASFETSAAGFLGSAISTAANSVSLVINQEKERSLQNLRLEDLRNTPDQISVNGSLFQIIQKGSELKVFVKYSPNLDFYKRYYKAYGYKLPSQKEIKNIRSHSEFDYIRGTDIIFAQDNIKLSVSDMLGVLSEFSSGMRVWYKIESYKNFDIDNSEV